MKLSTLITGKAFKRSFLAAAVAVCASSAYALPVLPQFTFDPTAFCSTPTCTAVAFDADNVLISDFATVTTFNDGKFAESGYLQVSSFQLGAMHFTPAGLNADGGYSLYISFTATGHTTGVLVDPDTGDSLTAGVFDTLNYSFIGAPGAVSGANTTNAGQVALATGSLIKGKTTLETSGTSLTPGANASVTFNPVLNDFFTDPVPFYNVSLTSFTNTSSQVILTSDGFNVVQGGGLLNFTARAEVPEPGTLALLGVGLLGFALRKRKQS